MDCVLVTNLAGKGRLINDLRWERYLKRFFKIDN